MKHYFFLAGMPRSGSTVLASILNQNPEIYVTPTSPLLDLLCKNEVAWRGNPCVTANYVPKQLENLSKSLIQGCWQHIDRPYIIDKHRGWGRNINTIKQIFGIEPKVIVTVRDVPSIVASFFRLLRKSTLKPNYIDKILLDRGQLLTDENRAKVLLEDFISNPWDSLKTAWTMNRENIYLVDYDELVVNRDKVVKEIYSFLNLPEFKHDYNNIENETCDDDLLAWGLENLHTIRPKLEKTAKTPEEVLGKKILEQINNMNLEFWR